MSQQVLKVIKSVAVTDAILTATSVLEADHAAWSGASTYALGDRRILISTHKIYESLQAGNLNKNPATEASWWVEVGPTNQWKLFDLSSTTQTQVGAADYYEFEPGQAVNAVSLVNISGILTVRVRLTDPSFGVVYDKTANLMGSPSESSWWAWFFGVRTEQIQFTDADLPSYPNATLRIDVTSSGVAFIGALVFGVQRTIGMGVQQGLRLGLQDYSRKERNEWGDTVLVQRAYAKRATVSMLLDNRELDNAYTLLVDLRATPCLWVISDNYSSLSLFGFFSNFEITISYARYSDVSIELESLT